MKERIITEFKYACKEFLSTLSISRLRTFGRSKGVAQPTTMKKEDLIDSTISILIGETAPIQRNNKGAPVKDKEVDPKIDEELNRIYHSLIAKYQITATELSEHPVFTKKESVREELAKFHSREKFVLRVEDPNAPPSLKEKQNKTIYSGQLEVVEGVAMLLPLNARKEETRIILPIECIRESDLREGDVITCYAALNGNVLVAQEVLTVNSLVKDTQKRGRFEELEVCYPTKRIKTYNETNESLTAKYMQFLIPFGKGQRGCIVAPPKVGKTTFLYDLIKSVCSIKQNLLPFVLLSGQAVESIRPFRKLIPQENLVYTTYEDDVTQQVFSADFLLKRVKRLAESGKDVILFVDSLTTLAKAFNETKESVGGKQLVYGLESKTLHYVKKFLGAARCFEKGGSLTIIATLSEKTGNPVDDILCADILEIANLEIRLNEDLAINRIYPAVDFLQTKARDYEKLFTQEEVELNALLKNGYFPKYGEEGLRNVLKEIKTFGDLYTTITNSLQ